MAVILLVGILAVIAVVVAVVILGVSSRKNE